jgi:CRP-like cAMP-binding protein
MHALDPLLKKFEQYAPLTDSDIEAILSWPYKLVEYGPGEVMAREGDELGESAVLLKGYTFRQKHLEDGGRQIVAMQIAGDFIDLHSLVLKPLDHSIAAVGPVLTAKIPHEEIVKAMERSPHLARVCMWDIALDGAVARQWMVTMGQKSAFEQLAHLICELFFRLRRVGLTEGPSFELMLTQYDLADMCGISPIHVNRSWKALERDGLLQRDRRRVLLPDIDALVETAGFNPGYLHLLSPVR